MKVFSDASNVGWAVNTTGMQTMGFLLETSEIIRVILFGLKRIYTFPDCYNEITMESTIAFTYISFVGTM